MTIRESAIAKMQQPPESLVQEISDFIDFIAHNHQAKTADHLLEGGRSEAWARWFEAVDGLEITSTAPTSEYQQRLLGRVLKLSEAPNPQIWGLTNHLQSPPELGA